MNDISDALTDEWFKAKIDRKDLKKLSQRSDWPGIRHVLLYFLCLGISGYMACVTWFSWWSVIWLWVYGVIFYASNPIWHECGHKTAFKSRWLNSLFYHIGSFMTDFEPIRWRWSHTLHHSNTISTIDPHDFEGALFHANPKPLHFFLNFVPFIELIKFHESWKIETIKHAVGITTPVMRECIPEKERSKCRLISRIHVSIWLIAIAWSFYIMNLLPVLLIVLPRYWGNIFLLINQVQHHGLAENIKDHRFTTRSVKLNPIFSFLYWKMEYHVEHHMFPMVPSYNLPKLHELIKDQLPKPNSSLFDAYKEIIPAIFKQYKDNSYYIKKQILKNI